MSSIDFSDLRHGVEVLREAVAEQDARQVGNVLRLLMDDTDQAEGSAANGLRRLCTALRTRPSLVTPVDVDRVSAWLIEMAEAYATGHEVTTEKRQIKAKVTGRKGGQARRRDVADRHAGWIDDARRILKVRSHLTPADVARQIADNPDESAAWDTIARVIRPALK